MSFNIERSSNAEELNEKIHGVFGALAMDKRRLPQSGLKERGMPSYVAEWLLDTIVPGQGMLSSEEVRKMHDWAGRYVPLPNDQNTIRYNISRGDTVTALTVVEVLVDLERKPPKSTHYAMLSLLGIKEAMISEHTIDEYPDLLKQGMWGVIELGQIADMPTILSFRPMQATVDLVGFQRKRQAFTLTEWRALLLTTMGYDPEHFSPEQQTYLLCRLLPLVQKHMHLIELAPKGTGKSYIYENVSPRVRLVSGGNITPAVLFINNASGRWGLLARFSVLVLDEVQSLRFSHPEEIVGALKGYLANGMLTRGGLHEISSDCGMVMLANIQLDQQQRPMRELIIDELPRFLRNTAFLDRIKGLIPGWKLPKLSSNMLVRAQSQHTMGLKADFFADVLLAMREIFEADSFVSQRLTLAGEHPYRRNEEAIKAIASGLLKLQFPDGHVSEEDFYRYCVEPAVMLRQGIWGQIYQLDAEYRQYERQIRASVS